jgi:undecaprenyl-diphosphatase
LRSLDDTLFPLLNRGAANPFFDWLMPRITNLHHVGWFKWLTVAACLFLLWKGNRRARVWVLCAVLAVGLSDLMAARVFKNLWPRDRPCQSAAMAGQVRMTPGTECPGSKSFPSNHAANMMALAGVGWWFGRKRERGARSGDRTADTSARKHLAPWLWFLLPLVIGYSRIYLGFHYPTDVLGGWALGALLAAGVASVVGRRLLPAAGVAKVTAE